MNFVSTVLLARHALPTSKQPEGFVERKSSQQTNTLKPTLFPFAGDLPIRTQREVGGELLNAMLGVALTQV